MSEYEIREPIQKRSIEKKEKIIESGFELICEKGYYNTNTAEIAKNAGVSTGIVYQYFKDKHDILIDALKKYADNIFQISGGYLYVNGVKYTEKFLSARMYSDYGPYIVPEVHYFLMGDNRNNSLDSRSSYVGCIDERDILGKVLLCFLPVSDFGVVK